MLPGLPSHKASRMCLVVHLPAVALRKNSLNTKYITKKRLRRHALSLALVAAVLVSSNQAISTSSFGFGSVLTETVASIEARTGGHIGVSVTALESGQSWSHRGDERFPIASTFKAFSCGHLLALADRDEIELDTRVRFDETDLQSYSPITKDRVGGSGMSLFELCSATTSMSDNTAANLILRHTGGPMGFTTFMRSIGDAVTRLDRYEPELNDVGPGEERDTTTPMAAARSLETLLLGDSLSTDSREQLKAWLINNKVGGPLLRASLPESWKIADRTGSGGYGSRGVIAVMWPQVSNAPTSEPVIVAVYLTGTTLTLEERDAAIAEVGAALVTDLKALKQHSSTQRH